MHAAGVLPRDLASRSTHQVLEVTAGVVLHALAQPPLEVVRAGAAIRQPGLLPGPSANQALQRGGIITN